MYYALGMLIDGQITRVIFFFKSFHYYKKGLITHLILPENKENRVKIVTRALSHPVGRKHRVKIHKKYTEHLFTRLLNKTG